MNTVIKSIFDEMINQVSQNMMDEKFDESCEKISNLARTLWFDHKALTFEEMSDIKRKVFEIRSKRMDEEYKLECARKDEEFKKSCAKMHDESTESSNNGWWIMEQNRIVNDMNQQMIDSTIIQNHIINSIIM